MNDCDYVRRLAICLLEIDLDVDYLTELLQKETDPFVIINGVSILYSAKSGPDLFTTKFCLMVISKIDLVSDQSKASFLSIVKVMIDKKLIHFNSEESISLLNLVDKNFDSSSPSLLIKTLKLVFAAFDNHVSNLRLHQQILERISNALVSQLENGGEGGFLVMNFLASELENFPALGSIVEKSFDYCDIFLKDPVFLVLSKIDLLTKFALHYGCSAKVYDMIMSKLCLWQSFSHRVEVLDKSLFALGTLCSHLISALNLNLPEDGISHLNKSSKKLTILKSDIVPLVEKYLNQMVNLLFYPAPNVVASGLKSLLQPFKVLKLVNSDAIPSSLIAIITFAIEAFPDCIEKLAGSQCNLCEEALTTMFFCMQHLENHVRLNTPAYILEDVFDLVTLDTGFWQKSSMTFKCDLVFTAFHCFKCCPNQTLPVLKSILVRIKREDDEFLQLIVQQQLTDVSSLLIESVECK